MRLHQAQFVLDNRWDSEGEPKPLRILVDDGTECTVYREWSPRKCPLAAGISSGLYHFPVSQGDVVFVAGASCETLSHIATLVGPTGQVRALIVPGSACVSHRDTLLGSFSNVWLHVGLSPMDPAAEHALITAQSRALLDGVYSTNTASPLTRVYNYRESFIKSVASFLGAFPTSPAVEAALFLFPPGLPPLSPPALPAYEAYLSQSVPRLLQSAHSVWLTLALPVQPALARLEEAVDYCCERLFDILATAAGPLGGVRPKEQLRVDPQYAQDTVLLVARYKRGTRPPTPTPLSVQDLLVQAFASLASQAQDREAPVEMPEGLPSILSGLLGDSGAHRAQPRQTLDAQLLFDLEQAKQGKRLTLSHLVGPTRESWPTRGQ